MLLLSNCQRALVSVRLQLSPLSCKLSPPSHWLVIHRLLLLSQRTSVPSQLSILLLPFIPVPCLLIPLIPDAPLHRIDMRLINVMRLLSLNVS